MRLKTWTVVFSGTDALGPPVLQRRPTCWEVSFVAFCCAYCIKLFTHIVIFLGFYLLNISFSTLLKPCEILPYTETRLWSLCVPGAPGILGHFSGSLLQENCCCCPLALVLTQTLLLWSHFTRWTFAESSILMGGNQKQRSISSSWAPSFHWLSGMLPSKEGFLKTYLGVVVGLHRVWGAWDLFCITPQGLQMLWKGFF